MLVMECLSAVLHLAQIGICCLSRVLRLLVFVRLGTGSWHRELAHPPLGSADGGRAIGSVCAVG